MSESSKQQKSMKNVMSETMKRNNKRFKRHFMKIERIEEARHVWV